MSEFNSCAKLVNEKDLDAAIAAYHGAMMDGKDPFQVMLDMQTGLQVALSEKFDWVANPTKLETCGEILDWMRLMDDAIADETRELYTSLGGMSNGKDASAVWKVWKKNHGEARARKFSELSPEDQLEAKFEAVDALHFILSKLIPLGIDAEELFILYYLKNAENFARQERGY